MERFIAYEKLSKKEQKKLNAAKRGSWGLVKPITKVKESAKIYNRINKLNIDIIKRYKLLIYRGGGKRWKKP